MMMQQEKEQVDLVLQVNKIFHNLKYNLSKWLKTKLLAGRLNQIKG